MVVRSGEPESSYFRSARIFFSNMSWYFSTREQINQGPFATKTEAQNELDKFILYVVYGGKFEEDYIKFWA